MSTTRKLVIAIDGPAGSGKSTIAARLAKKLGYVNLESGAMYRALALKAMEHKVSLDDGEALRKLAENTVIQLEPRGEGNRVLLDGRDVSQRIREADVTAAASRVSMHPPVRQLMVARQRELGKDGGVVMEGRDIGTAVFPERRREDFSRCRRQRSRGAPSAAERFALARGGAARTCRDCRARRARPHPFRVSARPRARRGAHRYHAQEH